jgi:hypothetical protein
MHGGTRLPGLVPPPIPGDEFIVLAGTRKTRRLRKQHGAFLFVRLPFGKPGVRFRRLRSRALHRSWWGRGYSGHVRPPSLITGYEDHPTRLSSQLSTPASTPSGVATSSATSRCPAEGRSAYNREKRRSAISGAHDLYTGALRLGHLDHSVRNPVCQVQRRLRNNSPAHRTGAPGLVSECAGHSCNQKGLASRATASA